MGAAVGFVALLLILVVAAGGDAAHVSARRVEVYGFAVEPKEQTFMNYDWSVLTASAWRTDPKLISTAQLHGARVEVNAGDVRWLLSASAAQRKAWVEKQLVQLVKLGATGINFDLEIPMQAGSQAAANYSALVQLTADQLHNALPGSTVSVDVPWSPWDVDGRNYDWLGLAKAADLLFVMSYDVQSQILGRCIASANSPIDAVSKGLRQWLALGVPASQLVLGLPWYGYDYQCKGGAGLPADVDVCALQPVAFQNVSCSDAAGVQRCYADIMTLLHGKGAVNTTELRWDATQASPYFNYRAQDGSVHQVWFDDPRSLSAKYALAASLNLRGIGMWNLDCLDYSSKDPIVMQQTQAMWQAVRDAVVAFPPQAAVQRRGSRARARATAWREQMRLWWAAAW